MLTAVTWAADSCHLPVAFGSHSIISYVHLTLHFATPSSSFAYTNLCDPRTACVIIAAHQYIVHQTALIFFCTMSDQDYTSGRASTTAGRRTF